MKKNKIVTGNGYYTGGEQEKFAYFRVPKFLTTEAFGKMSSDAKIVFGVLIDRVTLSRKNNWVDEKGRVYLYFTIEEGCGLLGKSRPTVMKALAELEKSFGLIQRKKQGLGLPDKIYIKSFSHHQVKKDKAKEENIIEMPVENSPEVVKTLDHDKSKLFTCSSQENSPVLVKNLAPNNPENIKPEFINSLPPSEPPIADSFPQPEYRERERVKQKEINALVFTELNEAFYGGQGDLEDLIYSYRDNRKKMKSFVKHLTNGFRLEEEAKITEEYSTENLSVTTKQLYGEALLQLLLSKENMTLKGQTVTYSKVIEKLVPQIRQDIYDNINLGTVMSNTVGDFICANRECEIKSPLAYMKSCIWSTLQEGLSRSELDFHHQFG